MSNILIIAKGTYGDIFPMYALAHELRQRGHQITFATQLKHEMVTRSLGYPVVILNQPRQKSQFRLLYQLPQTPAVEDLVFERQALETAAAQADLLIGTTLVFFGTLIAKKLHKPWVYCIVSPLELPSRYDSTLFPYLHPLQRKYSNYPQLQPLWLKLARAAMYGLSFSVTKQRQQLEIHDQLHPCFEGVYSSELNLLLTSTVLTEAQADWPKPTHITGFTWFDGHIFKNAEKLAVIENFLQAGTPPIVFTLGGGKRNNPGTFFQESIKTCEILGIRGIFVADTPFHFPTAKNILMTSYFPYAELFPQARAIVHSGGIGTVGWCLKYSIPSLIIPAAVDQFDNAYRVSQRGYGNALFQRQYCAKKMAVSLTELLNSSQIQQKLKTASQCIAQEHGTNKACDYIERLL